LTVTAFENVPAITDLGLGAMADGKGGVVGFRATADIAEVIIVPGRATPLETSALSNYLVGKYGLK
jgi:hypothetical protein